MVEIDGVRTLNERYILKEQLGSGSFGIVYLAEDIEQHLNVAIKECSKSKLRKRKHSQCGIFGERGKIRRVTVKRPIQPLPIDNPIDLVRGEIAVLKRLNHRNVVKLYAVLDDPDQDGLYMVFELCLEGPILNLCMTDSVEPLTIDRARDVFHQLILGIEYLHEHEIAHRDIKPGKFIEI